MFIKLRENLNGILAINLKSYNTILIDQNDQVNVLKVALDSHSIEIEKYETPERALQAFENMMDKLKKGTQVCHVSDF